IPNMNPLVLDSARYPDMYVLANGTIIPQLPNAVLVLLVAVVVAFIIFNKTIFGRYNVSIGSNQEATALSGVNVKKWLVIIYAAAGMFTAVAGVLYIARFSGITSATTGVGFEMQAIAATVIGGTSLSGGKGSIIGTLIGALVMATINYGLLVTGVPQQWQNVILGLVIVIVVFIDQTRVRRANAH
ncbi:MAG: ABC transporter permease, partial [Micrococcales bacterium]|nr:ABC transporter permease [Micrococcales bacterium]